jgi:uncharacterized repeat protein (TIGR01451 family)
MAHAQIPSRIIVNPSFEIPNISTAGVCTTTGGTLQRYLPDSSYGGTNEASRVPGWRTSDDLYNSTSFNCPTFTLPYRPIEYFRTPQRGSAAEGQQWAELNAENPRRLYQNVCLVAGESVPYTYSHRARFDAGIETTRAAIYAADGVTLISAGSDFTATSIDTWDTRSGVLTNTGPSGAYQYGFEARIGAGGTAGVIGSGRANEGNFLDNIRITLRPLTDINRFVDGPGNTLSNVGESRGTIFLEVILNGTLQAPATITLTRSGAASTADFSVGSSTNRSGVTASANASGDIALSIPAGEYDPNATTGSQTGAIRIPISITNDSSVEGNEPLTYTITAVSNPGAPPGTGLVTEIGGQSARCTTAVGSTTLTIQDEADLAVEKTGPSTAIQGDPITYIVKVWNRGPTSVSGASFTDSVPSSLTGVTWTCVASGSAVCGATSGSGNNISVTTGVLPVNSVASNPISGSFLTFTISGIASSAGSLVNTARIAAPGGVVDPGVSNNTSSIETLVAGPPPSIAGTVYNDNNGNSTLNIGEPRLVNVTVELLSGNTVIQTQSTDSEGNYLFTGMGPGTYTVRVTATDPDLPQGSSLTTPNNLSVTVVVGSRITGQNFGFRRTALDVIKAVGTVQQVSATAFVAPFTLVVGNTGQLATPNVQVTENLSRTFPGASSITIVTGSLSVTPSSGAACTPNGAFSGTSDTRLLSGSNTLTSGQSCAISFQARVEYPSASAVPLVPQNNTAYASSRTAGPNPGYTFPGGVPTPPTGAVATDVSTHTTHPASPGSLPGMPGGDTPSTTPITLATSPGSVSGLLYIDRNNDGVFNSGDDARLGPDIMVELVNSGGSVVATTQTDGQGNYSFASVPPGTYTVRVALNDPDLGGVVPTAPPSGERSLSVLPGVSSTHQNFGFGINALDVVKSAAGSLQTSPQVFEVSFTVVGGNTGTQPLPNVQITENLALTFAAGSPTLTMVSGPTRSAGTAACTVNSAFNGISNTQLLTGGDTWQQGQYCVLTFTVRVNYPSLASVPGAVQNNSVYASSIPSGPNPGHTFPGGTPTPPAGALATDTSTNAAHPATQASLPTTPNADTPSATPVQLEPLLPPPPVARDDAKAGDFNQPVVVPAIINDSSSPGTNLASGSIDLDPSTPGQETSRTIPGKGTFVVQADGTVRFDPVPGFEGTAVAPYTIKDSLNQTSNPANIAVTIRPRPAPPTAQNDQAVTPKGRPVTLDVVANDSAVLPSRIDPSSIDLDPDSPGRQTTRSLPGRGTFEALADGTVVFTPEPDFTGTVSIPYTIADQDGDPLTPAQTSNRATLTVIVNDLPAAVDDRTSTPVNTPVSLPIAANDVANPGQSLVPSTIDLDPSTPGQQTSRTLPGQGTFDLQSDGTVRFTPVSGFVGMVVLPYTVQDSSGATTSPASIVITVTPPSPVAANDQTTTAFNTPVTLYPSANDTPGAGGQLLPSTIDLDPATPGQQTERVVPGRGRFVLQPATNLNNESVQFIPETGFSGLVSIPYTIQDNFGQTSSPASLTVTVNPPTPPIASSDSTRTARDTPVTLSPAANDSPGLGTSLEPGSIDLDPSTPGQQTRFEVPGQGVFELQPGGTVRFTPASGFTGIVEAPYTIQDRTGQTSNRATLRVTVNPLPAADSDSASTPFNTPVTLNPLTNDTASSGAAFDPATLDLDPATPGIQDRRAVPGRGIFSRNPDGSVTFTPEPGFTGSTTIPYTVRDSAGGTTNTAEIVVTVLAPTVPVAHNDQATTPYNTPVTLNPLSNDAAGAGASLDLATLDLDPATPGIQDRITAPGKGTFSRNPDGSVTFTPVEGFVGTVEIPYTIRDNAGQESNPATIRVEVRGPNLVLEKTAGQSVARTGGSLEYILRATNQGSGVPMRQVTLSDLLPAGLEYRAGSSALNGTPVSDPQITSEGGRSRLVWVIGELASGQSASLRFATTVTAAAPTTGQLVNTAEASALIGSTLNPVRVNSNVAAATVRLEPGVFSDQGTIVGRVYFDKNNDNNFTSGVDEPLQGVRVYLSDGRYAVTDAQGRYSLTEVAPGLNALRVDRLTVPYVPRAVPDDRGLHGSRQVRVDGAGIYTEDFLFEAPASQALVIRSTRVTVDGQRLEKTITQVGAGSYTVTFTLTLNKAVNHLRIFDPLPEGGSRGALTVPNLHPSVQGSEIRLGSLPAGTYTLSYTLSGNIPIDRLMTDPDLFWEEMR